MDTCVVKAAAVGLSVDEDVRLSLRTFVCYREDADDDDTNQGSYNYYTPDFKGSLAIIIARVID